MYAYLTGEAGSMLQYMQYSTFGDIVGGILLGAGLIALAATVIDITIKAVKEIIKGEA